MRRKELVWTTQLSSPLLLFSIRTKNNLLRSSEDFHYVLSSLGFEKPTAPIRVCRSCCSSLESLAGKIKGFKSMASSKYPKSQQSPDVNALRLVKKEIGDMEKCKFLHVSKEGENTAERILSFSLVKFWDHFKQTCPFLFSLTSAFLKNHEDFFSVNFHDLFFPIFQSNRTIFL